VLIGSIINVQVHIDELMPVRKLSSLWLSGGGRKVENDGSIVTDM
jgi:hypothetical protein